MTDTDTSDLEMNLRNILNTKFDQTGGKKRRSRKASSKKASRKAGSKKLSGGKKRRSRKASSKKGSRKATGGMWKPKKATGGKKRRSKKASSKKGSRKAGSRKASKKASSKKGSRKGSRARRGLPPAMIAFGKIRAHIMKKLGVKMAVALQIAKKVRDEVMSKYPNVTDHDDIAKKSIQHFDANESKFSAKAARMA